MQRGHFTPDFLEFMRSLATGEHNVGFVTTSLEHLKECCPVEVLESPFFNIFKPICLGSFAEAEMDEFLTETSRRGNVPIADHKERIERLAGRFPYFVQLACWHYYEAWLEDGKITEDTHEEVEYRFTEDARPHLEGIWDRHLSPDEQKALAQLLEGKRAQRSILRRLRDKGYVLGQRIFSSVLADVVRDRAIEQKLLSPPPSPVERESVPPGVWIDEDLGDVYVDGKVVDPPLTSLEYRLMLHLWKNRGKICGKYEIVANVWGDECIIDEKSAVDDRRIAKLVDRLRSKIEPDPSHPRYIRTVHGRGYRLLKGRRTLAQTNANPTA